MLTRLLIRNFAIIERLDVEFPDGFIVLTGETGAGKSIIIDAIDLLMGNRSSEEMIRGGSDDAEIEGTFHLAQAFVTEEMKEFLEEDTTLIVYRRLSRNKPNVIRINDRTVTLKTLKTVMSGCVSIIGQHEHLELFEPERQRELVDLYGGAAISQAHHVYAYHLSRLRSFKAALDERKALAGNAQEKIDFLTFQIQDIETQRFRPDEDKELEQQRKDIKHRAEIQTLLNHMITSLDVVREQFSAASRAAEKLAGLNQVYGAVQNRLTTLSTEIEDQHQVVAESYRHYEDVSESDLDALERRLDTIFRFKQKYKTAHLNDLIARCTQLKKERQELESIQTDTATLEQDIEKETQLVDKAARALSDLRRNASAELSGLILKHMKGLQFPYAEFSVDVRYQPGDFGEAGADKLTFLVSTNAGQPPLSLSKVASGGELSRILLAIRTVFFEKAPFPTLIFDEVDTGVGGLTANAIGEKLKLISGKSQVFCVTHLAQIARMASVHFYVEKKSEDQRTVITLTRLSDAGRKEELKRMLGGEIMVSEIKPVSSGNSSLF